MAFQWAAAPAPPSNARSPSEGPSSAWSNYLCVRIGGHGSLPSAAIN
jgi:hypothetical protein